MILQNRGFNPLNHVRVWQMSPQLSCGDTFHIRTGNSTCDQWLFRQTKRTNRSINPQPCYITRPILLHKHRKDTTEKTPHLLGKLGKTMWCPWWNQSLIHVLHSLWCVMCVISCYLWHPFRRSSGIVHVNKINTKPVAALSWVLLKSCKLFCPLGYLFCKSAL